MKYLITLLTILLLPAEVIAVNELVGITSFAAEFKDITVEYDTSKVIGPAIQEVENYSVHDLFKLSEGTYERKKGFGDRINVVPGVKVRIYGFFKNLSQIPIYISEHRLYISRTNLNNGDLTRLGLNSSGSYLGRKTGRFRPFD